MVVYLYKNPCSCRKLNPNLRPQGSVQLNVGVDVHNVPWTNLVQDGFQWWDPVNAQMKEQQYHLGISKMQYSRSSLKLQRNMPSSFSGNKIMPSKIQSTYLSISTFLDEGTLLFLIKLQTSVSSMIAIFAKFSFRSPSVVHPQNFSTPGLFNRKHGYSKLYRSVVLIRPHGVTSRRQ
jgi:hypothetical protein